MDDLHRHMQLHACMNALGSCQKMLEETIGRMMELMKALPEGEVRDKLMDEIKIVDVTADTIRWAVQMMESEGLPSARR
jgi:hypothetical protein